MSIVLFIVSWNIYRMISWEPQDPLYQFLQWIKAYINLVLGIVCFTGWSIITYYFMSKPLRYLDEIIDASKQLATSKNEPIVLPNAIKNVQDELNLVREQALNHGLMVKEAEQRKNDLVVYLAHDLKTPLTSVIGYLTLLQDEHQISEELKDKYLAISLDKAERLEDLINEFFEITQFNFSDITLQYSEVNLTILLEQLTHEFKPLLTEKNLKFKLDMPPDTIIKCDVNKIQRVFDNLLQNAIFHSFNDSTIEIFVSQNASETAIKFNNYGHRIPKEKLEHIFEQFYRLDAARASNNGGAGLGLAIAKKIVELHQGTIFARSEKDQIEFTVIIPVS